MAGLELLPEVPACVYLNDARGDRVVPPGEGEVDWPGLAAALRERGFAGPAILALEGAEPWAVEPAAKEGRALAEEWFGVSA